MNTRLEQSAVTSSPLAATAGQRPQGFTLVEVLIAIGIFAIGMVAVAAIFPTALTVQRQSNAVVEGVLVADNAAAMIRGEGLTKNDMTGVAANDEVNKFTSTKLNSLFPFTDRANLAGLGYDDSASAKPRPDYVWYPMAQNLSGDPAQPEWVFYLLIINTDRRYTGDLSTTTSLDDYIDSRSITSATSSSSFTNSDIAENLEPGDWVLVSNGTAARIVDIDSDTDEVTVNATLPSSGGFTVYYAKSVDNGGVGKCHYIAVAADVVDSTP